MRKIPEIELEGMSRKLTIVLNDMKYNPSTVKDLTNGQHTKTRQHHNST